MEKIVFDILMGTIKFNQGNAGKLESGKKINEEFDLFFTKIIK